MAAARFLLCPKQNEETEKRNSRTHEHQGDVFPGRLQSLAGIIECYQKHREQRGEFNGNPYERRLSQNWDKHQRKDEQIKVNVIGPNSARLLLMGGDVSPGE